MTLLPTRQPINTDVVPHTSNSDDIEIMVPIDYNVIIFDIYSDDTFSEPPKRLWCDDRFPILKSRELFNKLTSA